MRIVFMGTPDFAVPFLSALHAHFEVVGVLSQPDRPAGRGRQLQAPALASRLVGISRCQEGFSISVPPSPRFSLFIPRGFFIVFPPHHPTYILQIDECLPIVCVRVVPCAPPPP